MRKKIIDKEAALIRCADLCSKGEHCESEIRDKLFRWGIDNEYHDSIVDYLYENNFIDNERFAHAFANDKVKFSAWGRIKIRLALHHKHIPSYAIEQAIADIDKELYIRNLQQLIASKIKRYDISDYTQRNTVYRQLLSKGYESNLIIEILSSFRT